MERRRAGAFCSSKSTAQACFFTTGSKPTHCSSGKTWWRPCPNHGCGTSSTAWSAPGERAAIASATDCTSSSSQAGSNAEKFGEKMLGRWRFRRQRSRSCDVRSLPYPEAPAQDAALRPGGVTGWTWPPPAPDREDVVTMLVGLGRLLSVNRVPGARNCVHINRAA